MPLNKAPIGTVLTADVTVTETPVVDRTITTLKGKVWVAGPTSVILTLESGENKQYDIPSGFKFDVDGKKVEAMELRPGMNITGDQDRGGAAHRDHDGQRRHGRRAEEALAALGFAKVA